MVHNRIIAATDAGTKPPAFYVPVRMNPKILPKEQRQYAAFFLNLLHWKWCCWQAEADGFIRLKQEYILRVIPQEIFHPIRRRLVGRGIVEFDATWVPDTRCQGYRLADAYRKTKRIVCRNKELAERIQKLYTAERGPCLPVHRWLESKLDLLTFDWERAQEVIAKMQPDDDSSLAVEEYRQAVAEACQRLAHADHWFHCDDYGRCHTPVTNLPKELRCCLSVDGQPLVNLDLANSQPLMAGIVAAEYYGSKRKAARLLARRFGGKNPYCGRTPQTAATQKPDLANYLKVCEEGRLYESLMLPGEERERFKREFFGMMYGKKRRRGSRLEVAYPAVAEMLARLKRRDYRHAAHLMQNVEATLFIHCVCGRLMQEEPTMPVYTIHDSVLTTPEYVGTARKAIREVFGRLGLQPTIREEECK